jgi:hypothetical protein
MVQGAAGARELPYDALLLGTGRKANVDSVGAISKHPARLCRPGRQASARKAGVLDSRDRMRARVGLSAGGLEGDGFEPSVPRSRSGDFRFRKVERV